MNANLEKARQSVLDSARMWASTREPPFMAKAMEIALLSAVEDLVCVELTGEFPPGKWEGMEIGS